MDNVMTLDGGTGHCRLAAGIDSRSKEPQPAAVATVNPSGEKVENLVQAFDRRGDCVKASQAGNEREAIYQLAGRLIYSAFC